MIIRTIGSLTSAYATTSSPGRFSLAFQSQGKAPWGRGCLCYHKLMTFHTMRLKPFFYCSYFGLLWWWWWRWEGFTLVLHLSYMSTLCCRNPCLRFRLCSYCACNWKFFLVKWRSFIVFIIIFVGNCGERGYQLELECRCASLMRTLQKRIGCLIPNSADYEPLTESVLCLIWIRNKKMLETLLRSYPRCLLKVNNLKTMVMLQNFVVRPVTLCMHVHSTEGCISGKTQAFIKKFIHIGCWHF